MKQHIKIFIDATCGLVCRRRCLCPNRQGHAVRRTRCRGFQEVAKGDILGGIAGAGLQGSDSKNYNNWLQPGQHARGYVSGYNGNSPWASGDRLVPDGATYADTVLPTGNR